MPCMHLGTVCTTTITHLGAVYTGPVDIYPLTRNLKSPSVSRRGFESRAQVGQRLSCSSCTHASSALGACSARRALRGVAVGERRKHPMAICALQLRHFSIAARSAKRGGHYRGCLVPLHLAGPNGRAWRSGTQGFNPWPKWLTGLTRRANGFGRARMGAEVSRVMG